MAQALVCGNVAPQHGMPVKLLLSKGSYASLRCKTQRLNFRHCRTCGAYQQEVEETFRPKVPSTAPGPHTTRPPPPPPPPPPPAPASGQFPGQTRRTMLALVAICSVAYGYNITQHPDAPPAPATDSSPAMAAAKSASEIEQSAPASARSATPSARSATATANSADVYANSELRPTRVWPRGAPENPYTQVVMWGKAPYARMRNNGWMRIYGMQPNRNGKVEMILEARGGKQYTLEVPLKQVRPWDMQFMNALFNSLIDWDSHLKPFAGKIKNKDPALM